jgi:amidase
VHIDQSEAKDCLLFLQHDVESMDNRLGAWAYKVDPKPTEEELNGILKGGSVVLKDNMAPAGVPCLVSIEVFTD